MNKYQQHVKAIAKVYKQAKESSKGSGYGLADCLDNAVVECVWCGDMVRFRNKYHFRQHYTNHTKNIESFDRA